MLIQFSCFSVRGLEWRSQITLKNAVFVGFMPVWASILLGTCIFMKKKILKWTNVIKIFYFAFRIYYFAMNHTEVYACLRVLLAQTGMNPTKTALFSVIRDLHSKPRTLKQLTRISIYNSIRHKPSILANKLPLPPQLREYLIQFEPWCWYNSL